MEVTDEYVEKTSLFYRKEFIDLTKNVYFALFLLIMKHYLLDFLNNVEFNFMIMIYVYEVY